MGWLFLSNCSSRKELLDHLRRPERFGSNHELLRSQAVGNNHWYLAKNKTSGEVFIGLDLMQGACRIPGHGWGYKDLDETAGPYEKNCPLSYLDMASEATGYAIEWRAAVRKYHADRKERGKPVAGAVAVYGGVRYILDCPAAPRKGWHVRRESDGWLFRIKARQLSQSKILAV